MIAESACINSGSGKASSARRVEGVQAIEGAGFPSWARFELLWHNHVLALPEAHLLEEK
jgi:hypothetical protein